MDGFQLRELQQRELEILLEVHRICQQHRLTYYLIGGSALGAIRHGGFIPWDDDIDIAMPRPDYRRFLDICDRELPDAFFLQMYRTQPDFPYSFAKVNLNNSTFIEHRLSKLNIHHGIYIDIFPLDGVPRRQAVQKAEAKVVKFLRWAILIRRLPAGLSTPITYWRCWLIDWLISRFPVEKAQQWGNVVGGLQEIFDREVFGVPVLHDFEGHPLPLPHQWEYYLSVTYGNDYMDIPPAHKRRGHDPIVVDVNKSYREYWPYGI